MGKGTAGCPLSPFARMKSLIFTTISQIFFLILLFAKDKNDGEKELFKKQQWKALDVIIVICSINIFIYIIHFLSQIPSIYLILKFSNLFLFHLFLFLLLIALFIFRFKQNFRVLGFNKNNLKKVIGLGIAVAIIGYLCFSALYLLIGKPGSYALEVIEELRSLKNFTDYTLYVFVSIIFAPFVEESIFTGILYSPYRKKYGPYKAIIISAIFFSISHVGVGILPVIIGGILKSMLYEKTESIISPIIAHSLYNLFAVSTAFYLL